MVPIFFVYQIMFGSQKWKHLKVACTFNTLVTWAVIRWEFTVNSHSQQPQIFRHCQNFHMARTPWPKIQIQIASSSEITRSSFFLDCCQIASLAILTLQYIVIVVQKKFTHPPLPEVWLYSQNFWSQNFHFLTPHSFIGRFKSPLWMQLDHHLTYWLCLCKFNFSRPCLKYLTALTMHCMSRRNEFFPWRENVTIVVILVGKSVRNSAEFCN